MGRNWPPEGGIFEFFGNNNNRRGKLEMSGEEMKKRDGRIVKRRGKLEMSGEVGEN